MITRSDLVLLLTDLQEKGIDVTEDITKLYQSSNIPVDVLKKINNSRPLDLLRFYEKLRESYNKKRSKLYINIMKSDENAIDDAKTRVDSESNKDDELSSKNLQLEDIFFHQSGKQNSQLNGLPSLEEVSFITYHNESSFKYTASPILYAL